MKRFVRAFGRILVHMALAPFVREIAYVDQAGGYTSYLTGPTGCLAFREADSGRLFYGW